MRSSAPGTPGDGAIAPLPWSLAAAVVHDLRNPLGAIAGEIELALRRERSAADYRASLERIAQQVSELEALTSDLALLANTSQPNDLEVGPFPQSELVAGLATLERPEGALAVQLASGGLHVIGNPTRVSRALVLLATHALGRRRAGAAISVRVLSDSPSAGWARIRIEPTPPGLVPGTWDELAAGSRSARTASHHLRVQLAQRFIEQSGGVVTCDEQHGLESIEIRLPRIGAKPARA